VGRRASAITNGDTSRNDDIALLVHTMCSLMAVAGAATPSAAAVADAKWEMLQAASDDPERLAPTDPSMNASERQ
jgi:hypothetical protein